MAMLFGGDDSPAPTPAPVPVAPTADTGAAERREAAERAALAESKANGRRSTIVAGMKLADEEQAEKGELAAKRRAGVRRLGE